MMVSVIMRGVVVTMVSMIGPARSRRGSPSTRHRRGMIWGVNMIMHDAGTAGFGHSCYIITEIVSRLRLNPPMAQRLAAYAKAPALFQHRRSFWSQ